MQNELKFSVSFIVRINVLSPLKDPGVSAEAQLSLAQQVVTAGGTQNIQRVNVWIQSAQSHRKHINSVKPSSLSRPPSISASGGVQLFISLPSAAATRPAD